jgi:putative spermidine/putrescine transport system permease protein
MAPLSEATRRRLTRTSLWTVVGSVSFMLLVPGLMIVPMSLNSARSFAFPPAGFSTSWFENLWASPEWYAALMNSLNVGVLVTVVSTVIGTLAAIALERTRHRRVAAGMRALLMAPLVIPAITLAVGIFALYLRIGMIGTFLGFVLAHTVLAVPFVMISVETALKGFDPILERAAASLSAGPVTTFFRVTLPNILPGVLSGALFAFATSFDEIMVSLFVKSPLMQTLPVLMYQSASRDVDPTSAAAAVVMLGSVLLMMALFGVVILVRNRKVQGRL